MTSQETRELLELAAYAVGLSNLTNHFVREFGIALDSEEYEWWNPLTNKDDAFDLMVKLGLEVKPYFYFSERCQMPATVTRSGGGKIEDLIICFPTYSESFKRYEPEAATMLAITRAAAAIGKQMKERQNADN